MSLSSFFADASPRKAVPADHLVGLVLCLAYTAWLVATARTLGFPRDEGFYFRAAHDYAHWFEILFQQGRARAFQQPVIDASWGYNHEHPALAKTLFAFGWMFLSEKWHVFADPSTCMRFPAMLMGGGTLWLTYLFGAQVYSRRAGLVAAISLGAMPHVFFHAHLACFDVPILFMWTLCIYVYWRSVGQAKWSWIIAAGIVYGLTLETKHNAWVLPAVFLPHAMVLQVQAMRTRARRARFAIPGTLVSMAVLGPIVFVALWPWLWNDTLTRIGEYVGFHMNHEYYNIEFLHRNYFSAPSPWAYAPVMIAASVPTVTLLLLFLGAGERLGLGLQRVRAFVARRIDLAPLAPTRAQADLLFALAAGAAIAPFFLPRTPIFGGTKHWITAYPFLALFAGRGFDLAAEAMGGFLASTKLSLSARRLAPWALAATVVAAPLAITAHSHPFGISAYVPFVGGTQGGASLGLFRQFWGYTTQDAAPYLDAHAPPNGRVFIHDTAWDSWMRMLAERRVRPDLRAVGSPGEADVALVQYELHMMEVDYQMWSVFGPAPADVVTHDGVPFVGIYQRATP